jgi:hypothetical protein
MSNPFCLLNMKHEQMLSLGAVFLTFIYSNFK